MDKENMIKLAEAAKYLPFWSKATIKRHAADGLIPCVKIGRQNRFYKSELEAFVKSFTTKIEGNYGKSSELSK